MGLYADDGDVILSDGRRISPEELAAWILANTAPTEAVEPDLEPEIQNEN